METIDRWRKKEAITAEKLNRQVEATNYLLGGAALPSQVRRGGRGRAGMQIQLFEVIELGLDHVKCYSLDGAANTTSDIVTRVALPYLLRKSLFDGETRNGITYEYDETDIYTKRVATDSESNTETQVIVPSYVEFDLIFAASSVAGGTYAWYEDDNGVDQPITWLDLNLDGRAWAKEA